ncbi:MAG: bifunctional 5,10-methylenetetrahydrofolate dehydrogenase/5,10-methenyltetrahydrofolate cyclohydrolase [Gammaproteobacteria bacterium]|nr:bifunctional 5,10-methylenetetrahydrofolate dehydrogenase/5,10-methenyltetrahydrofolate cyclohydrolase [Gammaproteobacteria bacterium]
MTAFILNGQTISTEKRSQLKNEIQHLKTTKNIIPKLVVLLVGEHPASQIYVNNKQKACINIGIDCTVERLSENISQTELKQIIINLNQDPTVNGILIQLPLPGHIQVNQIIELIDPLKDVDGFHPLNMGLLSLGTPRLQACTPFGIMQLFESYDIDLKGRDVLMIGASRIVGLPMALELHNKKATVTLCHSESKDLQEKIIQNEIIIVAAGKRDIIKPQSFRNKHIIIDVGIHRLSDNRIVGDVDFSHAESVVKAISPVPGGVGPMTITALLHNVVRAVQLQIKKN